MKEKKTKEWDRKQIDDKKYAVTYAGYIKIHVEKDIIAIAYWYTRDISFPLFTSFVYDNLLFFLFWGNGTKRIKRME